MKKNDICSKMLLMRSFYLLFLLLGAQSLIAQKHNLSAVSKDSIELALQKITDLNKQQAARMQFQYFIIKAEQGTYGYDIYADGLLYIHQPNIPAIEGVKGFADTTKAGIIARTVIQKIKNGEIPPVLSLEELETYHVIPESKTLTPMSKRKK